MVSVPLDLVDPLRSLNSEWRASSSDTSSTTPLDLMSSASDWRASFPRSASGLESACLVVEGASVVLFMSWKLLLLVVGLGEGWVGSGQRGA